MMNNAELALAISVTQDRLHKTGTAYAEHGMLVEHLRKLLAEQVSRATAKESKQSSTGSLDALQPCECVGCICIQGTTPHMMLSNRYCKMARAGVSGTSGSVADASDEPAR
jgi:hypothetical protein